VPDLRNLHTAKCRRPPAQRWTQKRWCLTLSIGSKEVLFSLQYLLPSSMKFRVESGHERHPMKRYLWPNCASYLLKFFLLYFLSCFSAQAAELPAVRITQAILNEKSLALWIGVEQGFFRKHGVSVEIIQTRTSTQTIAALASGEIQIAGTTPSVVLNAALAGMDVAFFCGIVNRADGDFMVAPGIRRAEDLIRASAAGCGPWPCWLWTTWDLNRQETKFLSWWSVISLF
jgi:hypothetical protein